MEFNINGSVKAASVTHLKRVELGGSDSETVKEKLAKARYYGKVKLNQIASYEGKEWLRVKMSEFNGAPWIEIQ